MGNPNDRRISKIIEKILHYGKYAYGAMELGDVDQAKKQLSDMCDYAKDELITEMMRKRNGE